MDDIITGFGRGKFYKIYVAGTVKIIYIRECHGKSEMHRNRRSKITLIQYRFYEAGQEIYEICFIIVYFSVFYSRLNLYLIVI